MSRVICHVSDATKIYISNKVVKLIGGGYKGGLMVMVDALDLGNGKKILVAISRCSIRVCNTFLLPC